MTPKVFLSHSRRDTDIAAPIARDLRRLGVEPFDVLESVASGEDWRQTVNVAIREAHGFVLVVGAPEAASSSWVVLHRASRPPVLFQLPHQTRHQSIGGEGR